MESGAKSGLHQAPAPTSRSTLEGPCQLQQGTRISPDLLHCLERASPRCLRLLEHVAQLSDLRSAATNSLNCSAEPRAPPLAKSRQLAPCLPHPKLAKARVLSSRAEELLPPAVAALHSWKLTFLQHGKSSEPGSSISASSSRARATACGQ